MKRQHYNYLLGNYNRTDLFRIKSAWAKSNGYFLRQADSKRSQKSVKRPGDLAINENFLLTGYL
jgi:hypothetical protein